MVRTRHMQEICPSSPGNTLKFWGRLKLRLRRRLKLRNESSNNFASNSKDNESEDGQSGEFDLQRMGRGGKHRLFRFAHNWALVGTGRWLRLAGSRFLLRVDARVSSIVKGNKGKIEELDEKVLPCSICESTRCKEGRWKLEKQVGKMKITTWMNGKGRRSIRAPLIGRPCNDVDKDEGRKEEDCIIEGFCGCTGGRVWRSREKSSKEGPGIGLTGQRGKETRIGSVGAQAAMPDDIIEMCLARTPFASLMRARAVCKKWKDLSLSPHFFQLRERVCSWQPWLFLFGLSRDGVYLGQIQALDPALSRWHTIKADILTGRLLYSVTAVDSVIYIVGGCSSSCQTGPDRTDEDTLKPLKTVLMYTPLTGSWTEVCPLTTERSASIVGVFKLRGRQTFGNGSMGQGAERAAGEGRLKWVPDLQSGKNTAGRKRVWKRGSRNGGELAVYGGTEAQGRVVNNNALIEVFTDVKTSTQPKSGTQLLEREFMQLNVQGSNREAKDQRKFGLIAVGGQGTRSEQLNSAEIYDPLTDSWREVACLPVDHGTPCAGVVSKNFFYVYSESNKLAAFDLDQEVWHSIRVSQAPSRLLDYTPKLVSCRDRVFLLGVAWGMISDGGFEMATRKIWELHHEPTSTGWVKVSQHPDAPLDWNAVFVGDEEKIFGVEMFKIFGQILDFVTVCNISGSGVMAWERVSRLEMAIQEMDISSCLTKTAIVVRL